MKLIGIQRKLDELGRIVLPVEIRKTLNITEGDKISISMSGGKIILEKFEEYDFFTGSTRDLIDFKGKKISRKTIIELIKIANITNDEIEAENNHAEAESDNAEAESDNDVAESDNAVVENDNAVAGNDNAVAENDNAVAGNDDAVAVDNHAEVENFNNLNVDLSELPLP